MLTFETHPQWFELDEGASMRDRVTSLQRAPWGGSTDFSAALDPVLEACINGGVSPQEVGELVLVVDYEAFHCQTCVCIYQQVRLADSGEKLCLFLEKVR